ncbi:hypothetical protein [Streptomyces sp. NPDC051310]|uniref:hypothetical protein n=1 Tax=Streptomyces sp. NPDC051310 TaxID=3365649 RepID=UPI0037ABEC7C
MTRAEYPWLLPSDLAGTAGPVTRGDGPEGPRPRRTVRDWIVDTVAFVLAAFFGILAAEASRAYNGPGPAVLADQVAGAAACLALSSARPPTVPRCPASSPGSPRTSS